jgi:hypothetical protein
VHRNVLQWWWLVLVLSTFLFVVVHENSRTNVTVAPAAHSYATGLTTLPVETPQPAQPETQALLALLTYIAEMGADMDQVRLGMANMRTACESRDLPRCKVAVGRTEVAVDNWHADLEKTKPPGCMRKVHREEHTSMRHFQTALRLVDQGLRTSNVDLISRGTRAINERAVHIWTAVALRDIAIRTCSAEAAALASSASGR